MSANTLTTFEKAIVNNLAHKAGLAATLFDVWSELPDMSAQSERSLIDLAQLGLTEEQAAREILVKSAELGLLVITPVGFRPGEGARDTFKRLALALNSIDYYISSVHRDATISRVVLTKPPKPSTLEHRLSELGWRTSELEPTNHAFHSMVRLAKRRVVVMTPFFDARGASWLRELFSFVPPGVERILILRSLEDSSKWDYPQGYDVCASWITEQMIQVLNYSLPRIAGTGRETFHAKVILCDRNSAYLGSSNMNAASLEHSMEMGVTLQGRAAGDVATVLDAVIAAATQWH